MYSNVKFYEKEELHEIHFPGQLGGLKGVNSPGENTNTFDSNMFVCIYVCVYIYIYMCVCVCVCVCEYIYACVCVCV